jgi:peptidoglycan/LPS O-acetylase OafA/YrhL
MMGLQKKYYPQLDAIRGISVLSVFFFHAYKPAGINQFFTFLLSHMGMGLDVFFVLSSFLITFLGINEYQTSGSFLFKKYFIRRALRIWPLYFLLMIFFFLVVENVANYNGVHITMPPPIYYLFFISNFYLEDHVFFLRLLWTLSVEEQFYIVWGLCLLFFQRKIEWIILLFVLISLGFNFYSAIVDLPNYFNSLTYLIDMMIGAFTAFSILKNNSLVRFISAINSKRILFYYLSLPILFFIYFLFNNYFDRMMKDIVELLFRLLFISYCGFLIIHQLINENSRLSLSRSFFLIYTGKISYGLYCFHGIVISLGIVVLPKLPFSIPLFFWALILLAITFIISAISYQFIEKPFLKLKSKIG